MKSRVCRESDAARDKSIELRGDETACSKSELRSRFSSCVLHGLVLLIPRAPSRTTIGASKDSETAFGFGLEGTQKNALQLEVRRDATRPANGSARSRVFTRRQKHVPLD